MGGRGGKKEAGRQVGEWNKDTEEEPGGLLAATHPRARTMSHGSGSHLARAKLAVRPAWRACGAAGKGEEGRFGEEEKKGASGRARLTMDE